MTDGLSQPESAPVPSEEELSEFCDRLAELRLDQARAALKNYFRELLDSMSIEEIHEAKAVMLDEAGEGRERLLFETALNGYLATRHGRN